MYASSYTLFFGILANIASAEIIKLLAVVDKTKTSEVQGLTRATSVINQDPSILAGHTLSVKFIHSTENETFEVVDTVCTEMRSGFNVLLDLSSPLVSSALSSLSKRMALPHVAVITDSPDARQAPDTVRVKAANYAMTQIVRDIVSWENLTNVGILYDETFDLDNEQKKLLQNIPAQHTYIRMTTEISVVKEQLNDVMDYELNHLFILGTSRHAEIYLSEANYKDMISFRYTWYVLTQDLDVPCEKCKTGAAYLTLTPVPNPGTSAQYLQRLNSLYPDTVASEDNITVSSVTSYDLMFYTAKAIERIPGVQLEALSLNCIDEKPKNSTLRKQFKDAFMQVNHKGVFTDKLTWDQSVGFFDLTIDIDAITINATTVLSEQLGNWSKASGLRLYNDRVKIPNVPNVYRIATIEGPPFVFIGTETPPGVDRYYYNTTSARYYWGYCIDLIFEIQSKMKFEFTLYESPDGSYGSIQPNGSWDGMVNELIQDRADIIVAPLSVMAERENVIDFTVPYYDLVGISILMKKPQIPYSVFRFMSVLEEPVWGCIFSAFIIVSIMLAVFDKFSPYSYQNNRHIWDGEGDEPRVFTLKEGLWFCMTSLTPQGGGEAPRALSGRLLAATWWMFGFIIIATYTANLAAFLTVSRLETPIESLDDLAKQFKTKYAPEKSTATEVYFKRMADIEEMFYHIWKDMSLNDSMDQVERAKLAVWDYPVSDKFTNMWVSMEDSGLPPDFETALDWVKNTKSGEEFAFLGDATRNKYAMLTDCDLWEVGEEFSRKPYALAVQEGSPLKNQLSSVILQLLNQRILEDLKTTWWEYNKVTCDKLESESDGISIRNIGGVFIVIFIGIGLGLLTLAFEYYWYRWRPQANSGAVASGQASGKQRQQGQENQAYTGN